VNDAPLQTPASLTNHSIAAADFSRSPPPPHLLCPADNEQYGPCRPDSEQGISMDVKRKVLVVTGGGNGMGREVVIGLIARGARVAAVDLSEAGLAETARLAGAASGRLTTHALNVTDRKAVLALPAAVIRAHGQVDGLLNVAGIIQRFV